MEERQNCIPVRRFFLYLSRAQKKFASPAIFAGEARRLQFLQARRIARTNRVNGSAALRFIAVLCLWSTENTMPSANRGKNWSHIEHTGGQLSTCAPQW